MACNAHLGEVNRHYEALMARGCSVAVVSQSQPEELARYAPRLQWRFPIYGDPQRQLYQVIGLERTRWWMFVWPPVILGYLWGMLRGYLPRLPRPGEDVLQLGGDFLLDRYGRLVYAYRSATPTDRPSTTRILQVLDRLRSSPPTGSPSTEKNR
ncbi:MAG: SelL-related redox protein [Gemmataceae bacterium]|nr:SelL-related redox protein [Gemmataceae bacterium]